MAIIQFENGIKVNFEGNPTQADVEEVYKKISGNNGVPTGPAPSPYTGTLGTNPSDSMYGKILDNSITRGIQNIFPGKQVGTAVGNSIDALTGLVTGDMQRFNTSAQANNANMAKRVAGDVANIGLTTAAPGLSAESALGRIGLNTALGAGIGTSGAIANDMGVKDVAKQGIYGGLAGGAISGATEAVSAVLNKIPDRIIKTVLPRLKDENAQYALENLKFGRTDTLIKDAINSSKSTNNEIKTILNGPQYARVAEDGKQLISNTIDSFGASEYTPNQVVNIAKRLTPKNAALITKMEANQANLSELNKIREGLDAVTEKRFTDAPNISSIKEVGARLADVLRLHVQESAPTTAELFARNSKELNFAKALMSAKKQTGSASVHNIYSIINHLGSPVAGIYGAVKGFGTGDTTGKKLRNAALGGVGGFTAAKFATSPAARLMVVRALNSMVTKTPELIQGIKAPIQNAVQNVSNNSSREQDYLNQLGL